MRRILFVDDEPRVLEGLERMLRLQRRQWDMSFAQSGLEALALLETGPCDVIVTDMRMPEMDGARLLELVQERFPGVVRIVLSGHVEMEAALRAAPVAHQFLSKPCDPAKLREAIERAIGCRAMLGDECVRRIVGSVGKLPSRPDTYAYLLAALEDSNADLLRLGRIVEQDVGITAKVLQLVNSAFFGLRHEISSARQAVTYLGLETLKQLIISVGILHSFQIPERSGFCLEEFEAHSRLAARITTCLPLQPNVASTAFVAALLHDTGKLVLAARLPEQFENAWQAALRRRLPVHILEQQVMGTTHAEVGGYLLGLWGLPKPIVEAVYAHHRPNAVQPSGCELSVTLATHIADALANEIASGQSEGMLDIEYLSGLGLAGQLPQWRAFARLAFEEHA